MTFLSGEVTLEELDPGNLCSLLSASSRSYLSVAPISSIPDMPEMTRESRFGPKMEIISIELRLRA
jgi:hypothetical protein